MMWSVKNEFLEKEELHSKLSLCFGDLLDLCLGFRVLLDKTGEVECKKEFGKGIISFYQYAS